MRELPLDGGLDRDRRRHRPRRPAARRARRQRRTYRPRGRRARRPAVRVRRSGLPGGRGVRARPSRPSPADPRRRPARRWWPGPARWSAGRWPAWPTCSTSSWRRSAARWRWASGSRSSPRPGTELAARARLQFSGPLPHRRRPAGAGRSADRRRRGGLAGLRRPPAATVNESGRPQSTDRLGPSLRAAGAVLARPRLWSSAARLAPPGWWRRWPPSPLPPADYVRFRTQTMYGDDGQTRCRTTWSPTSNGVAGWGHGRGNVWPCAAHHQGKRAGTPPQPTGGHRAGRRDPGGDDAGTRAQRHLRTALRGPEPPGADADPRREGRVAARHRADVPGRAGGGGGAVGRAPLLLRQGSLPGPGGPQPPGRLRP